MRCTGMSYYAKTREDAATRFYHESSSQVASYNYTLSLVIGTPRPMSLRTSREFPDFADFSSFSGRLMASTSTWMHGSTRRLHNCTFP